MAMDHKRLLMTAAILFAEIVLGKIKIKRAKPFRCVVNYQNKDTLDHVLRFCKDRGISIKDLQIEGERDDSGQNVYSAFISLQPNTEISHKDFSQKIESFDGVISTVVR